MADGLYVDKKVINLCKTNGWDYILRYKEGCAKSIEEDIAGNSGKRPDRERRVCKRHHLLGRDSKCTAVQRNKNRKKEIATTFEWITSIEITEKNAEKLAGVERRRWKIENQGFNRQKHWQGNLEHACSHNENAQKNHYIMEQIADFMKQLYEY